jgi:hypothetical protein
VGSALCLMGSVRTSANGPDLTISEHEAAVRPPLANRPRRRRCSGLDLAIALPPARCRRAGAAVAAAAGDRRCCEPDARGLRGSRPRAAYWTRRDGVRGAGGLDAVHARAARCCGATGRAQGAPSAPPAPSSRPAERARSRPGGGTGSRSRETCHDAPLLRCSDDQSKVEGPQPRGEAAGGGRGSARE